MMFSLNWNKSFPSSAIISKIKRSYPKLAAAQGQIWYEIKYAEWKMIKNKKDCQNLFQDCQIACGSRWSSGNHPRALFALNRVSVHFTFSHLPHNLQLHFHIQQPTSKPAASFSHSATYPTTCNLTFTFTLSHLPLSLSVTHLTTCNFTLTFSDLTTGNLTTWGDKHYLTSISTNRNKEVVAIIRYSRLGYSVLRLVELCVLICLKS